jgi:hypothetical protein
MNTKSINQVTFKPGIPFTAFPVLHFVASPRLMDIYRIPLPSNLQNLLSVLASNFLTTNNRI